MSLFQRSADRGKGGGGRGGTKGDVFTDNSIAELKRIQFLSEDPNS
jgi:hypothetical protein